MRKGHCSTGAVVSRAGLLFRNSECDESGCYSLFCGIKKFAMIDAYQTKILTVITRLQTAVYASISVKTTALRLLSGKSCVVTMRAIIPSNNRILDCRAAD